MTFAIWSRAVGPDIDDLVVAFAGGDDTLAVLLLDFGDLLLRSLDFLILLLRNDHVVDADGDAGLASPRGSRALSACRA